MSKNKATPVYMQIAIDMANRIRKQEFKIGDKIRGRSSLASEYNVSPETIRKAMNLLSDMDIVVSKKGNGFYVSSSEFAEKFLECYQSKVSINEYKQQLSSLYNQRKEIDTNIKETIDAIIDYSSRFKRSDQVLIYEFVVPENSLLCNKSIGESSVWQFTGATIVGVKRSGNTIVSPGPYEIIREGDKLLYVGDTNCYERLEKYTEIEDA